DYLGPENFSDDELVKISKPGIVNGLAWTQYGGATLVIESIGIDSPKAGGSLKLTGQLGDVMSESANIAFSYIQHVFSGDENTRKYMNDKLIHLHVPAGATPKDGPSAGVTMAASLYSLIANRTPKQRLAMTGELTLSGRVLPVGGIKEKIIAAKRAGIKEILLPVENDKDLKEVPDYIKKGIKFHLVREIDEVLNITFNR
ncbi:MAG TPA: magnesium chelatase domain-containing protein, partial [Spirochaetota bacterium]|nr:magnesium chelatase domain-containing protein [Spirochaetota bacterium]